MQIENSQCTLAQAQIGRYVAGETLPEDVLTSLEAHLDECSDCRSLVREQRAALEVRAGEPAAEPIDAPNLTESFPEPEATPVLAEAAVEASITEAEKTEPQGEAPKHRLPAFRDALKNARNGKRKLGNPLIWSGALAFVLVAMSYVAKNPSIIFGKKASDGKVAKKEATSKESEGHQAEKTTGDETDEGAKTVVASHKSDESSKEADNSSNHAPKVDQVATKQVEPRSNSEQLDKKSESGAAEKAAKDKKSPIQPAKRQTRRAAPARPRQDTGTIKVYDAAGKPIHP